MGSATRPKFPGCSPGDQRQCGNSWVESVRVSVVSVVCAWSHNLQQPGRTHRAHRTHAHTARSRGATSMPRRTSGTQCSSVTHRTRPRPSMRRKRHSSASSGHSPIFGLTMATTPASVRKLKPAIAGSRQGECSYYGTPPSMLQRTAWAAQVATSQIASRSCNGSVTRHFSRDALRASFGARAKGDVRAEAA